MNARDIVLGFAGFAAIVHVASYIMIMADLDRRGYKTNVLMSGIYFGRYLKAYRDATVKETGRPGPLYRVCITAVLIALVLVVASILVTRA